MDEIFRPAQPLVRASLALSMDNYENINLLDELGMDPSHIPNYEPGFLNLLKMVHIKEYEKVKRARIELYGYDEYDPMGVFKKMLGRPYWE